MTRSARRRPESSGSQRRATRSNWATPPDAAAANSQQQKQKRKRRIDHQSHSHSYASTHSQVSDPLAHTLRRQRLQRSARRCRQKGSRRRHRRAAAAATTRHTQKQRTATKGASKQRMRIDCTHACRSSSRAAAFPPLLFAVCASTGCCGASQTSPARHSAAAAPQRHAPFASLTRIIAAHSCLQVAHARSHT